MKQAWLSFLHWKGWKSSADFCVRLWKAVARWSFWKTLFGLPFPALVLLIPLCGAGLVWVFVNGFEAAIPAYFLYALSAYTTTASGPKKHTCLTELVGKEDWKRDSGGEKS